MLRQHFYHVYSLSCSKPWHSSVCVKICRTGKQEVLFWLLRKPIPERRFRNSSDIGITGWVSLCQPDPWNWLLRSTQGRRFSEMHSHHVILSNWPLTVFFSVNLWPIALIVKRSQITSLELPSLGKMTWIGAPGQYPCRSHHTCVPSQGLASFSCLGGGSTWSSSPNTNTEMPGGTTESYHYNLRLSLS